MPDLCVESPPSGFELLPGADAKQFASWLEKDYEEAVKAKAVYMAARKQADTVNVTVW